MCVRPNRDRILLGADDSVDRIHREFFGYVAQSCYTPPIKNCSK